MHYFLEDLFGAGAATALSVLLLLLPGFGIADLLIRRNLISTSLRNRTCWGLVLAPTLLPVLDGLLVRLLGFEAALFLHVALGALGSRTAVQAIRRVPVQWWWAVAGCFVAAAWANVDFDWNGRLYQSVLAIDGVKHAAVIGALATTGIPLHDPFFARPGIAGYYYYFYIGPGLVHWLCAPWIDSRAAFVGATFITLIAFPATLILLAEKAALIPEGKASRFIGTLCVLSCLSGLDFLPGLWIWTKTGTVLAQLDWWDEEVRWALSSVLWVPHHITAVMAVYVGALLIAENGRPRLIERSVLAGLAFATAFGCSVWIVVAAAPILILWWIYERFETGPRGMWALPLSGLFALLCSVPQILDITKGRALERFPVGFICGRSDLSGCSRTPCSNGSCISR